MRQHTCVYTGTPAHRRLTSQTPPAEASEGAAPPGRSSDEMSKDLDEMSKSWVATV